MKCNRLVSPSRLLIVRRVLLLIALFIELIMPNLAVANTKSVNEAGFGISAMGGHTYGTNGIGVWLSGRIHVGLSDTIDTDFAGAGVVEAWLSPDHLKQAKEIQAQLCKAAVEDPKNEVDPVEPSFVYSVDCLKDGQLKTHQGKLYELPKQLCFLLTDYYRSMLTAYAKEGRAIAKISVNVESVVQQKEKFLASIVYRNSGDFPMKMFMPDRWAEFGDKLEIGGVSADGKDRWEASLAGLPLVNKADFAESSDGIITIPAGGSVTFKYLTVPDRKIKRGTYKFNALTFVSIGGEGVVATMGKVDFRSDRSKPTRATFERDYPSTSQEWNEYEARHRQDMSSFPVKPGETFAEDGFYRYVIHSQRSRFVFSGRKGEVARSYTNIVNEKGEPMDGSAHWIWEADRAVEDHCSVNDPCPRDGRWTWASNYSFRDYMGNNNRFFERRFVAGELMPELELNGTLSHYSWTWIGV